MPNLTPFYLFSTITMNPLITKIIPLLTFFKWCLLIKGSSFSSTIWMSHMRSPKTTIRSGSIHSFQSVLQHVFFLISSLLPLQHWIPVNSSAPLYSSFPILADCRSLIHWGKIHPLHNISRFAFYFNMYRANISLSFLNWYGGISYCCMWTIKLFQFQLKSPEQGKIMLIKLAIK